MSVAIITGASSGMGREFARTIQQYFDYVDEIWLIARREERLKEVAETLKCKTKIIEADLNDKASFDKIKTLLEVEKPAVSHLINCAGFGIMGKFSELDLDEQLAMVDTNVKALMRMTYLVLPFMKKKGRIIQLASVAAFLPQPGFAVYAATKSFVLSFSRALSEELRSRKITVTAVCPGPVRTEFFDLAERYGHTLDLKKYTYVDADFVVKGALQASRERKTYYTCSPVMKALQIITKVLPHSLILYIYRFLK